MQNNIDQGDSKKEQSKLNTIESINQGMINLNIDSQKHNLKEQKVKIVEKTQKIKKEKKHIIKNQYYSKAQIQEFQNELIYYAMNRLRNKSSNASEEGSIIHKKLTRQRLLQFLQMIQQEYSLTMDKYLQSNINKESCGNLKQLLLKFIDRTVQVFPVLNNIVYRYAFQYYKTGPLQNRFDKLMEKTITPMLNTVSQQFLYNKKSISQKQQTDMKQKSLDNQSTQISKSPERQLLQQFEEEKKKKLQKKKRRKNRKMQEKLKNEQKIQVRLDNLVKIQQLPKEYEQLNKLIQGLTINQNRYPCRIEQTYIQRWRSCLNQKSLSQS